MRILLAGGSGVIGTRLIPLLTAAGHEVTATTRRESSLQRLRSLGATAVQADVFDVERLAAVLADARPELVLHELTDLAHKDFEGNARLRREGTENLVSASLAAGVPRMMAQSIAWSFEEGDGPATDETRALSGSAVEALETVVQRMPHATVLRYGMLYGPGTWYASDGPFAEMVRAGGQPATAAITCFLHVDDAAAATVEAIGWPDGTYNLVDDEPAAGTVWLPEYAAGLGAPRPSVDHEVAASGRPVLSGRARAQGWLPKYASWRDGFPRA